MSRMFAALVVVWLSALPASADDLFPRDESELVPTLYVGDAAPELKVTKWLQGEAVTEFESGKIYVVEFWATWCGALHNFTPYLSEWQSRYKDKGVTIIGFTSRDIRGAPGNSEEEVAEFLREQRPAPGYTIAYSDDNGTADAWLNAAGERGFCTFVVDQQGRIAYMGHPMFLDMVLGKVLAGEKSPQEIGAEMDKIVAEYEFRFEALLRDFQEGRDTEPGLRALMEFETKYPPLTDMLLVVQAKLSLLPLHGDPGEAKAYAEAIVSKGIKQKNVVLLTLAYSILRDGKGIEEYPALALKAAEARVRLDGGNDAQSLLELADAYLVNGEETQAKKYAGRALEAAAGESADDRQEIEKEVQRLGLEE